MRVDETLTRLTAAHAGITLAVSDAHIELPTETRRSPAAVMGRVGVALVAAAVFLVAGFGWGAKTWLGSAVVDASALDLASAAVVDAAAQRGDENVLVVHSEPPDAAQAGVRADTVTVAHVPDDGGPVTALSFPTDMPVSRPACAGWDPGTHTYTDQQAPAADAAPLVSALDVGGPRCLTQVVQQLSGIAITQYIGTDLTAVQAMTDAVGGADVCVPRPVLDDALGPVVPEAGQNRLEGVKVADFVQAGDVPGDPSPDYGRLERQQLVLAAVLGAAMADTSLLDLGQVRELRPALNDAVMADGAGLDEALAVSRTLRRLDADGVRFAAVPAGDEAAAKDLFAAVRTDGPLPDGATGAGGVGAGPAPSEVTVTVLNATDKSGLAGQVSETLGSIGFQVGETGSAEQPIADSVIRFSPDQSAAAELLAASVPSAQTVPDPGGSGVLQLTLGRSFDDVIQAPAQAAGAAGAEVDPVAAQTSTVDCA